ncbi:MAG: ATP-grasp domain-containing protein [Tepidisphaera sp.]
MPTLIFTPRFTADTQSLWRAATELGWAVHRLHSWRVPDDLRTVDEPILYLEALLGPTIAAEFGLRLDEPPIDWLPNLPQEFRKREIRLTTLAQARTLTDPWFIKPPNDKSFPARVSTGTDLPPKFDGQMPVLIAEVVRWEKEFRAFILSRQARTISIYARSGELQRENGFAQSPEEQAQAAAFLESLLADPRIDLPQACVIDIGVIESRGWAVVEQNAAWGAGIYGCDPRRVLEVLRFAAHPARVENP